MDGQREVVTRGQGRCIMGSFMVVLFVERSYGDQIAERVKCVAGTINACFFVDRKCENSITLGRRRYR